MNGYTKQESSHRHTWGKMFEALQLSSYCALWQQMDLSKQRLKNYNEFMREQNNLLLTGTAVDLEQRNVENWLGYPLKDMIKQIPMQAAVRINGGKIKFINEFLDAYKDASRVFLVIAVLVLKKHYKFNRDKIDEWWKEIISIMNDCWACGMKDEFIVKYFKEQCDLDIFLK